MNGVDIIEPGSTEMIKTYTTRNECEAHRASIERRIGTVETDIRDIKLCLEKLDSDIHVGFKDMQGWIIRGLFISVVILISVLLGRSVDFGWLL